MRIALTRMVSMMAQRSSYNEEIKRLQQLNTQKRNAVRLSLKRKRQIDGAVDRVVEQYGDAIKQLAKE